jgi:hypothetical protein
MKIKQRLIMFVAGLTALVAVPITIAAPVQAAPGCFAGRVCLWDGSDFSGSVRSYTVPAVGCVEIATDFDNRASSYYNNISAVGTTNYADLYNGDGCTGILLKRMYPGTWSSIPGSSGNAAESFYVY